MPFKSEAQRRYMHANLPEIAQRWEQEYSTGGIASQGGMKNYLGEQPMVNAPKYWQSSPDHPTTELAYITPAEKDLLVKQDLHGSLNGGVNQGPSGIMSLNGWGSADESQNVSGSQMSAAEAGDVTGFAGTGGGAELPPGVDRGNQTAEDIRSAFIAAGGGQRVNPGFFDSRTHLSPSETALAKAYRQDPNNLFAKKAYRNTGQGGIMGFLRSGGLFGNLIRGLGQRAGLGKRYNEPTYDMRSFSNVNPDYYNDLGNELMLSPELDKFDADTFDDQVNLNNVASLINNEGQSQGIDFTNADAIRAMSQPTTVTNLPFEGARTVDTYRGVDPYKMNYLNRDLPTGYRSESLLDEQPQEGIMGLDEVPTDEEIAILRGF